MSHDDNTNFRRASVPKARFWILSIGVCMGLSITLVDTSIVATSLHTIGIEFGEPENLNWVALAYTLAYLSCAVTFARISDIVGRRAAFTAAQVIFLAFSLGCGFAQTLTQLIVLRALQGIGGSGLYSLSMVILPELVPEDIEKYMGGVIGIVLAGSGVLGPVLGGTLTHYAHWRWIFWVNGPIGLVSIAAFWFAWPKPEQLPNLERRKWKEFDMVGSLLLISAAVLVVFALQNAGHTVNDNGGGSWDRLIFILPVILGLLSWTALVLWGLFVQRYRKGRCLLTFPVSVFQNGAYAAATLSTLFMGFPYLLIVFSFPLREQTVSGRTPVMAGIRLLPMLGSTAVGTVIAGKISDKKNRLCQTMTVGSTFLILSCGLLSTIGGPQDDNKALGFLVFAGLGFGLSTAAATMVVSTEAAVEDYAPAQGILAQLRILGGSLGIAASTVFVAQGIASHLHGALSPKQLESIDDSRRLLAPEQILAVQKAYTEAFQKGMKVAAGVSAAALVAAAMGWRPQHLTMAEKRQQLNDEENERRRKQREKQHATGR